MQLSKATLIKGADGNYTTTVETKSFFEAVVDVLGAPFKLADNQTDYVSANLAAVTSIVWGVGGALVGEAYGHKRARHGSQSFLPIFR